ncbi:MAG: hypothetical protein J6Q61_06610 [Bacteroidales bacterium]|nr:hypothetical protein [Bacteroidales bacterium]
MKKAKTNRDEVRENSFTVMATKEEKERLAAEAHKKGLSLSSLVRLITNDYFERKGAK